MRLRSVVRACAVAATFALVPATAYAATLQPTVVGEKSSSSLPQVVASAAVPAPHVDAIATDGTTTYVGGLFDTMVQGTNPPVTGLSNIAAFNSTTGAFLPDFSVSVNGLVNDLELVGGSLYVAGDFTQVNGAARSGLVKLDATTGAQDATFKPYFSTGKVNDIGVATLAGTPRLVVGGGMSKKLAAVDLSTGKAVASYTFPTPSVAIPGAWGGVAIYRFAVSPDGTKLIATGNFQQIGTDSRTRFVMLDLNPSGAAVNPWYYPRFADACSSTAARRIAYLQGVDWSPDGSAFDVTATGQISKAGQVWHPWQNAQQQAQTTVCDGVGRFSLADPTKPVWINYTGGDSVWRVQDTGAAVYVEGHFQWLDNADGFASNGIGDKGGNGAPATPAVNRLAIGAIDPVSGRALSRAPQAAQFKQGGKALLATSNGLWIGNDSKRFGAQPRYGLAFAPLGATAAR